MKELSYKYQVIEETIFEGKNFYKVKDVFEDSETFVKLHKEINDMDWDESSKVEKELEELKLNNEIDDFFYNSNYETSTKIFYQVIKELAINPFELPEPEPEPEESNVESKTETENLIEEEILTPNESDFETKEEEVSTEIGAEAELESIVEEKDIESKPEEKKEEKKEKKIHKLNEIGGKVKVNLSVREEEDIFTSPLIIEEEFKAPVQLIEPEPETENKSLDLNYKKSHSRTKINNKIVCKKCEAEINHKHLNVEENIAYCNNCHAIRDIRRLGKEEETKINYNLTAPVGVTARNTKNMLYIETTLNIVNGVIMLLASLFFIFFASAGNLPTQIMLIAAIVSYFGVVKIANRLHIKVTKETLKVSSKPLPHFPEKIYKSKSISQLYVKEYIYNGKNGRSYTYKLRAILKTGKDISLVKLTDSHYALFLERSIESWLKIEDRNVGGEFGYKQGIKKG